MWEAVSHLKHKAAGKTRFISQSKKGAGWGGACRPPVRMEIPPEQIETDVAAEHRAPKNRRETTSSDRQKGCASGSSRKFGEFDGLRDKKKRAMDARVGHLRHVLGALNGSRGVAGPRREAVRPRTAPLRSPTAVVLSTTAALSSQANHIKFPHPAKSFRTANRVSPKVKQRN